jgi:hypothetical protein
MKLLKGPTARLTGSRCACKACGHLFNSVRAFEAHRTGTYRPLARRCLTEGEMRAGGMSLNRAGFWITETRSERATRRGRADRSGDLDRGAGVVATPTEVLL